MGQESNLQPAVVEIGWAVSADLLTSLVLIFPAKMVDYHLLPYATITAGQDPDQRTLAVRLGLSLQGLQKRFIKLNQQRRESDRKPLRWKRLVADVQATLRH